REPRIASQVWTAEDLAAQNGPFALVLDADENLAILGLIRTIGRDRRMLGASSRSRLFAVNAVVVRLHHPFAERIKQRNVEACAIAGPLALVQRSQHAGERIHSGRDVGN